MTQRLKRLPPMRETWVSSLGQEDPLEKEMAIHSRILAMDRGAWEVTVHRVAKSRTRLSYFTHILMDGHTAVLGFTMLWQFGHKYENL